MIPVQLGTARNSFKQVGFFLNQDFDLIRHQKIESDSSILKLRSFLPNKIRLTSYYDKQAWRYDDEGNQASFYPAFPKDSTVTRDIYTTESYHTRLFLYHTANKLFPVNYYAKLAYQTDKITDSVMNKTEEQSFAGLGMNTELILGIKAGIDWEQHRQPAIRDRPRLAAVCQRTQSGRTDALRRSCRSVCLDGLCDTRSVPPRR